MRSELHTGQQLSPEGAIQRSSRKPQKRHACPAVCLLTNVHPTGGKENTAIAARHAAPGLCSAVPRYNRHIIQQDCFVCSVSDSAASVAINMSFHWKSVLRS